MRNWTTLLALSAWLAGPASWALDVQPSYPTKALRKCVEGWVQMSVEVGADGQATAVEVTGSEPEGYFESAAIDLVKKTYWGDSPQAKELPGTIVTRVSFEIENNCEVVKEAEPQEAGCPDPANRLITLSQEDYKYVKENDLLLNDDPEFIECMTKSKAQYEVAFCERCQEYCSSGPPNQPLSKDFVEMIDRCTKGSAEQ